MVNALINWSLTAVTMNFEGIIAIINLNQWFITAIMWSFLLMVSRAACTIALKMFFFFNFFVVADNFEGRCWKDRPLWEQTKESKGHMGQPWLPVCRQGTRDVHRAWDSPQFSWTSWPADPVTFQTPSLAWLSGWGMQHSLVIFMYKHSLRRQMRQDMQWT